jgi:hypothetical protein
MFVCCACCVLSGRGFCDELITRPDESCQLWRVVVCDQETSKTRRLKPATGLWKIQPQWVVTPGKQKQTTTTATTNMSCSIMGLFWRFGRTCCLSLQADSLGQVDIATIGRRKCVTYVGSSFMYLGARGSAVSWDTALRVGRSQVRFPMVSLEFFIDIILPTSLWPWGWLNI